MTMWLKQSTAVVVSFGPFVDQADGVALETGLVSALDHASTGILLSKNGGALTIRHANVTASTYDAYGNYCVTLDTTDTNTLGTLRMQFAAAASCLPVWQDFMVVPANVWDSMFGADRLSVDVEEIGANIITAAAIANGAIDAATFAAGAIDAGALAADAVDEILDEVVEGTLTLRHVLKVLLAVCAGKSSGGGTSTAVFQDNADLKPRVTATVDASGNRTAVTLDGA